VTGQRRGWVFGRRAGRESPQFSSESLCACFRGQSAGACQENRAVTTKACSGTW
jgi:hypothetical protein